MLALIEQPRARERWRREPELTPRAIDEIMRYVTPVNTMVRSAAEGGGVGGGALLAVVGLIKSALTR